MRKYCMFLAAAILAATMLAPASGRASAAGGPIAGSYSRVSGSIAYLNLRYGPGYGYSVKTTIPKGGIVKVLSGPYNSNWYKVSYRGHTGYSFGSYLRHTGLAGASIRKHYTRVVVISRARQQVEVYDHGKLILVSAATTGRPELPTPTGTTTVTAKLSPYKFVSPWPKGHKYWYPSAWVKQAMRFRSGGYYLHDAPWRPYYGYGTNKGHYDPDGVWRTGSHGCVNLPLWSTNILYEWIKVGTVVKVVSW